MFEYSVLGEPAPAVRWFRGNRQIFPSGSHTLLHHVDGSGSLTVRECQGDDAGLYTCQARSPLGEAACSAELRVVRGAPGAPPCAEPEVAAGARGEAGGGPLEVSYAAAKTILTPRTATVESPRLEESANVSPLAEERALPTSQPLLPAAFAAAEVREQPGLLEQRLEPIASPPLGLRGAPELGLPVVQEPGKERPPALREGRPRAEGEPSVADEERAGSSPAASPAREPRPLLHTPAVADLGELPKESSVPLPAREPGDTFLSALAAEQREIRDARTEALGALHAAAEAGRAREPGAELRRPLTARPRLLLKEAALDAPSVEPQAAAELLQGRPAAAAAVTEEALRVRAERAGWLEARGGGGAEARREGEQPWTAAVVRAAAALPSEGRVEAAAPAEAHAEARRSPELLRCALAQDQTPVSPEAAEPLPEPAETTSAAAGTEPPPALLLPSARLEQALPKEGLLARGDPAPAAAAAQRVRRALGRAAATEERAALRAEALGRLLGGAEAALARAGAEPRPLPCSLAVAEAAPLRKERVLEAAEEAQRAGAGQEAARAALQLPGVAERWALAEEHAEALAGAAPQRARAGAAARVPWQVAGTEAPGAGLESAPALGAAEQDSAARIREGQAVRLPLALHEPRALQEERAAPLPRPDARTAAPRTPRAEPASAAEVGRSPLLAKERPLAARGPPPGCRLAPRLQAGAALNAALSSEPHICSCERPAGSAGGEASAARVSEEAKPALAACLVRARLEDAAATLDAEEPGALDPVPRHQAASARSPALVLAAAAVSAAPAHVEPVGRLPAAREPQRARGTVEIAAEPEEPRAARAAPAAGIGRRIPDVGAGALTAHLAAAAAPLETPAETLHVEEQKEEIREKGGGEAGEAEGQVAGEARAELRRELVDMVVEEGGSISLVAVIAGAKTVNWLFQGKAVSSGKRFKCARDQDTYTLVISKACKEVHEGEYACEALNGGGKTATAAKLTVVTRGWGSNPVAL